MSLIALMAALSERYSWKNRTTLPKIDSTKMNPKQTATAAVGLVGTRDASMRGSDIHQCCAGATSCTGPCDVRMTCENGALAASDSMGITSPVHNPAFAAAPSGLTLAIGCAS